MLNHSLDLPENLDEFFSRDVKLIRKELVFTQEDCGSEIIAVAVNCDPAKNIISEIYSEYGESISRESHNVVRDTYHIYCCDHFNVGKIPINYRVSINKVDWEVNIPLPFSLIKKYLTKEQLLDFNKWFKPYDSSDYFIKFIQFVNVY